MMLESDKAGFKVIRIGKEESVRLSEQGYVGLLHMLKACVIPSTKWMELFKSDYKPFIGYGLEILAELHPEEIWFPDPRFRADIIEGIECYDNLSDDCENNDFEDDLEFSKDLLCTGGDLSPERLRLAYKYGIFPWFDFRMDEDLVPVWYAPLIRFVLFPNEIHISHSMRTLLNKHRYRVTFNEAFPQVIEACRTVNGRYEVDGAWLGENIVKAYTSLWRAGLVKSVEVWDTFDNDRLVGGLYGVWINNCFMGESMFSYVSSGSKIALIALAEWMQKNGGKIIDLQFETQHLKSMGGRKISYYDYLKILNPEAASKIQASFSAPTPSYYVYPYEYHTPLLDIRAKAYDPDLHRVCVTAPYSGTGTGQRL